MTLSSLTPDHSVIKIRIIFFLEIVQGNAIKKGGDHPASLYGDLEYDKTKDLHPLYIMSICLTSFFVVPRVEEFNETAEIR